MSKELQSCITQKPCKFKEIKGYKIVCKSKEDCEHKAVITIRKKVDNE